MRKIVILGGGFGGLRVALEVEKRCARLGECEILLIDRSDEHLYTPLLYEVATGFLDKPGKLCRGKLREGICVRFEAFRTIVWSKQIQFRRAELSAIDVKEKTVTINQKEKIAYDDLVIALGSETAYYGIPGLEKFAFTLKTLRDALHVRDRVHALLEAYLEGKTNRVDIFVGGAGATGTEFACESANFFRTLECKGVIRHGDWSVTLVDAAPKILAMISDDLRVFALRRLQTLGVKVLCATTIKEVTETEIVMEQQAKTNRSRADVVIWCGGIKPAAILEKVDLPKGPKGHLDVDELFRVRSLENVYALGDCAQIVAGSTFVPATAQAATVEATALAENLVRHVEKVSMIAWKAPKNWITIIPMGGPYAICKIGFLKIIGRVAYTLRKMVDLRYWLQTLSVGLAFQVWFRGAKTYLKND